MKTQLIILAATGLLAGFYGGYYGSEEFANLTKKKGRERRLFLASKERWAAVALLATIGSALGIIPAAFSVLILVVVGLLSLTNEQGIESSRIYTCAVTPAIVSVICHMVFGLIAGSYGYIWLILPVAAFFAMNIGKVRFLEKFDDSKIRENVTKEAKAMWRKNLPLILVGLLIVCVLTWEIGHIMHTA